MRAQLALLHQSQQQPWPRLRLSPITAHEIPQRGQGRGRLSPGAAPRLVESAVKGGPEAKAFRKGEKTAVKSMSWPSDHGLARHKVQLCKGKNGTRPRASCLPWRVHEGTQQPAYTIIISEHFQISAEQNSGIKLFLLGSPDFWEIFQAYYLGDQSGSGQPRWSVVLPPLLTVVCEVLTVLGTGRGVSFCFSALSTRL